MNDFKKEYRARLSKRGLITLAVGAALLAFLIVINLLVSALPANVKTIDITDNKMYSVTDSSKRELAKTDTAVTFYLICQGGEAALADTAFHLDAFLKNAATVSNKITYQLIDPLVNKQPIDDLGIENVSNLSVVVKSALRHRVIPSSEFFAYFIDGVGKVDENTALYYYYYMGKSPSYGFDGETVLLSAVDYVCNPNLPTVYELSGHSETALSDALKKQLDAENFTVSSLPSVGATLPDDCDMLVINAPQTDLAAAEVESFLRYINAGGTVMMVTTPDSAPFTNLGALAAAMGMSAEEGIIIETNSSHYYNAQYPYYLVPLRESHTATASVGSIMLPFAHGIAVSERLPDGITVSPLFSTSTQSYILPIDAETVKQPEDTELRSFCVGAVSQNTNGGKLIWISSNGFLNDSADQMVSGGNAKTFSAIAKWVCDAKSAPSSSPLPLSTARLTIPTSTAGLLSIIIIFLLPLGFIGYGLFYVIRRKKR